MPAANKQAILDAFEQLKNMKEVSRQLGYSYTTVVQVVSQSRGNCQCGNPIAATSKRFCANCLAVQRKSKAKRRRIFADSGVCLACGGNRDNKRSMLCHQCRARRLEIQRDYKAKNGAELRKRAYGGLWLMVMERDNWACRVCGDPAKEVHHLDEQRKHNAMENLLPLCRACHMTLTRLNFHPNLLALLALVHNHHDKR